MQGRWASTHASPAVGTPTNRQTRQPTDQAGFTKADPVLMAHQSRYRGRPRVAANPGTLDPEASIQRARTCKDPSAGLQQSMMTMVTQEGAQSCLWLLKVLPTASQTAELKQDHLSSACCTPACLSSAQLISAQLSSAQLSSARLSSAQFNISCLVASRVLKVRPT